MAGTGVGRPGRGLRQTLHQSPVWREKDDLLRTVPGVGEQVSLTLLAYLPELGTLDRRQIAALVGVGSLQPGQHLVAIRRQPCVVTGGLDLHDAALGDLAGTGLPLLHLPSCVEAEVRVARALLGKLADAEDLGPERPAYGVQKVGQSGVEGSLSGCAARRPYAAQVVKILPNCCHQLRCAHASAQGLITSIPLPSKSSMSLVATDAPRLRAIAAIWQSA